MKNSARKPRLPSHLSKRGWFIFLTSLILIVTACSSNSIRLNNTPPASATPNHLIPTATALPEMDTAATTSTSTPIDLDAPSEVEWAEGVQSYLSITEDYWSAEWEGNSLIRFDFINRTGGSYIDVAQQKFYRPTPFPSETPDPYYSKYFSYSPDKKFFIECTAFEMILFRAQDHQRLGQAPVWTQYCFWSVVWADNSTLAAFVSDENQAYIWKIPESAPIPVLGYEAYGVRWSPDAQRLLIRGDTLTGDADLGSFQIAYPDGSLALEAPTEIEAGNGWYADLLGWQTNTIIKNSRRCAFGCYYTKYYDALTGRFITTSREDEDYENDGYRQTFHSPDGRWMILDQNDYWTILDAQNPSSCECPPTRYVYEIFDLQNRTLQRLADELTTYIVFSDWSPDASTFYFVRRPMNSKSVSSPTLPFGLYAFKPSQQQRTLLFEQALFAKWNPQKTLAFVVFPAKNENGELGLSGGIFGSLNRTLVGKEFASDRMLYLAPAGGDLVPSAWSNDGTHLVFGDSKGNLILLDQAGHPSKLASHLPIDSEVPTGGWRAGTYYRWSPNDQYLLIHYGHEQSWVINVPK